jgi:hypothetical protein
MKGNQNIQLLTVLKMLIYLTKFLIYGPHYSCIIIFSTPNDFAVFYGLQE